jgi:hypothetical protein
MNYQDLPSHSRVWIYQSNRKLAESEVEQIKVAGKEFIKNWATHGKALHASMEVFYNRFIVLFADEEQVQASGCSIDSSVHFMKEVEKAFGIDLFDRLQLAYKNDQQIDTFHINELNERLEKGSVNENTIVFNNMIQTKAELESIWEIPLKESWVSGRF